MSLRRALLTLCAAFLMLAAPTQTAGASLLLVAQQSQPLSLDEAAKLVQQRTGGRVLSAEAARSNGQTYYLIRILVRKGQVKVYRVDPHSGRIF